MTAGVPTHRALVREAGRVVLRRVPSVRAGPGDVVIAPATVGICGTDLQMLAGARHDPAPIIGHEGVGAVVEAGPAARRLFPVGSRVLTNPTHPIRDDLLLGHRCDGLLQERVHFSAASLAGGQLVPCPDGLADALAPLAEPLAAALLGLDTLTAALGGPPERLAIFGGGIVGHLVRLAAARSASSIDILHVHRSRATIAWGERHGFSAAPSVLFEDVAVREGAWDAALCATPRMATLPCLDAAIAKLRDGGAIALIGGLAPASRSSLMPDVDLAAVRSLNVCGLGAPRFREVTTGQGRGVRLTGQRGVSPALLTEAAALLTRSEDAFSSLVVGPVGLGEAADLLSAYARDGRCERAGRRFMKLLVAPTLD